MNIDKENLLKALRNGPFEGLRSHELAANLGADVKGRHRLRTLLDTLVDENIVEKAPGNRFRLVGAVPPVVEVKAGKTALPAGWVAGSLRVHPAGYGFVARDDGEDDVYVAARNRASAMDGDRVAISTWLGYKGTEGRIEKVLERGRAKLTGTLRKSGRASYIEPDDPRIAATGGHVLLDGTSGGAKDGQAVVAEITRYPDARRRAARGARHPRPRRSRRSAHRDREGPHLRRHPDEFPDDVAAWRRARAAGGAHRGPRRSRRPARPPFMTIDPETARDFDDAVCVEPSPERPAGRACGSRSPTSRTTCARARRSIARRACAAARSTCPTAPSRCCRKQLSAGICSLVPEVDRLAMVVRMELDPHGDVSRRVLLRGGHPLQRAPRLPGRRRGARRRLARHARALSRLHARPASAWSRSRGSCGRAGSSAARSTSICPKPVLLDEDDPTRVRDVVQSRGDAAVKGAYQLVEEFMLAANEAVARHFRERERRHRVARPRRARRTSACEQFAVLARRVRPRTSTPSGRARPSSSSDLLDRLHGQRREARAQLPAAALAQAGDLRRRQRRATSGWRRPTTCTSRRRFAAIPT